MKYGEVEMHKTITPRIKQIINSTTHTKPKQGRNWYHQQTQVNNWYNEGTQANNWNNQGQGRTWYNNTQNQNNGNHQDQNNGREFQGTCFICRKKGQKAENFWHHPENTH